MNKILFSVLLCAVCLPVAAQSIRVNPKPGNVSEAELALSVYPLDTTAHAVALTRCEEVQVETSDKLDLSLRHQVYERIKILKDDAKYLTDYKIHYYGDDVIGTVKVTTYNLVDGKVVKTKLDKKYVFQEKVTDGVYACTFSAPDVRVGSVVEVSYAIKGTRYWDYPELILQGSIPINQVTVSMEYPDFLRINRMSHGYLSPQYREEVTARALPYVDYPYCEIHTEEYSLADVPAIPREPSCLYPDQYRSSVSYELSGVALTGIVYKNFSVTWSDVDKLTREMTGMSQCTLKGKFLDAFVSSAQDEVTAITEVRNAVMAAVKCNESGRLAPGNVQQMLKEGSGSASTINALVSSVLIKMGYQVTPVFLRRRNMGILLPHQVRKDAFTDMILQVSTPSGATYYVDASSEFGGINILNPHFLVSAARAIPLDSDSRGYWVDLSSLADGGTLLVVKGKMQEDGLIQGNITLKANKESAYRVRQTRDKAGSDQAYIEFVQEGESYETVSGEYHSDPFSAEATFSIEYEQEPHFNGNLLYVRPFLMTEHTTDAFPPGERHTPVDFLIKEALTYIYTLELPEGYAVEQLPQTRTLRSPAFNALASFQVKQMGDNTIQVNFVFKNRDLTVPAESYLDLRAFWEQLCAFYKETIVLRKI